MWEDVLTYNPLNMVEIFHYRQNNLVIMVKNSLITILFKGILISQAPVDEEEEKLFWKLNFLPTFSTHNK